MHITAFNKFKRKSFRAVRLRKLFSVERKTVAADPVEHLPNQPVILLDVDGVINMGGRNSCLKSWDDRESTYVNGFQIQFSPTVVERINRWNSKAEVRWLTTWDEKAQNMLAPALKLDHFPLARDPYRCWGKLYTADKTAEEVGPDRLIIWIDDELTSWVKYDRDHQNILCLRKNTVLVSPGDGLRPEHLDYIDKILESPGLTRPLSRLFEEEYFAF